MTTTPETTDTAPETMVGHLADVVREALLDQHLHPDGEPKMTRFDLGQREGRILAHLEVLTSLDPAYTALTPASLRIVLLGEALTAHAASR